MTDKPTPEQIQRACDLLGRYWTPKAYGRESSGCLTTLADTIAQLDAMQAERDKARADLAEIDRIAKAALWHINLPTGPSNRVAAIAAPYRVETDPLVEALVAANARLCDSEEGYAPILRAELAKRGLEIGRAA